jgi:mono/diheme cytochrome c family protein
LGDGEIATTTGQEGIPVEMELGIMKLNHGGINLLPAMLAASLVCAAPAQAQSANAAPDNAPIDVHQLFATTCGWCHSDVGRVAGKGPQLMDTKRDDDFIRNRIKYGKSGAMPAFDTTFGDAQIDQIIKYIRELKPHEG